MVSWGANTTHLYNTQSPATPAFSGTNSGSSTPGAGTTPSAFGTPATTAFGSPSPASTATGLFSLNNSSTGAATPGIATGGGLFGTSTATATTAPTTPSLFGAPAPPASPFGVSPAPATSGLFGTTTTTNPAPAPLFGTAPPSTGTGLFGSTTATFGGFGSTGSSLFGSPSPAPTTSLFGFSSTAQAPQAPQIPAQAAIQAHMDASARQEDARVKLALQTIHESYTGIRPAEGKKSAPFCTVAYNPMTAEFRQQLWLRGLGAPSTFPASVAARGTGNTVDSLMQGLSLQTAQSPPPTLLAPPRPAQISEKDWDTAIVRNPDPQNLMPIALVGATTMQARLFGQQERVKQFSKQLQTLKEHNSFIRQWCGRAKLEVAKRQHELLGQKMRLLQVLKKIELLRCHGFAVQQDERVLANQLSQLIKKIEELEKSLASASDSKMRRQMLSSSSQSPHHQAVSVAVSDDFKRQVYDILQKHRASLSTLIQTVGKESRDLKLIQQDVLDKTAVEIVRPPGR